jgi:hypothetical protein
MPILSGCVPILPGCSAGLITFGRNVNAPILTGCSAGVITLGRNVGVMVSSMFRTHHEGIQIKHDKDYMPVDMQPGTPGNVPLGVFPVWESESESDHCEACQCMRQKMMENGAKILKLAKESHSIHELVNVQRAKLDEQDRQIKSLTNVDNAKLLELVEFQKMLLDEKDREIQSLVEEVKSLQAPAQISTTSTLVEKVDASYCVKDKLELELDSLELELLSPLQQIQILGA